MEALSCNHCCGGNSISIIHSQGLFIVLGNQHAVHVRHIVICGLPGSTILINFISHTADFRGEKVIEYKMRVSIFSKNLSKHFSFQEELIEVLTKIINVITFRTHPSCQILVKLEFSQQIFEKY
jgi:hypothetical protein